jgi:hypothetical protein
LSIEIPRFWIVASFTMVRAPLYKKGNWNTGCRTHIIFI